MKKEWLLNRAEKKKRNMFSGVDVNGNEISKHNYNRRHCLRPIWGARPHARTCRGHQLYGHQKQLRPGMATFEFV